MPRIESRALQLAEGQGASGRATKSEDKLIASIDRFSKYAIKRKVRVVAAATGVEQNQALSFQRMTKKKRELMRLALKSLVDAAT